MVLYLGCASLLSLIGPLVLTCPDVWFAPQPYYLICSFGPGFFLSPDCWHFSQFLAYLRLQPVAQQELQSVFYL